MSESTIDDKSGEGGFDAGASADELFGAIADEEPETAGVDREGDADTDADTDATDQRGAERGDEGIEDRTAANVFGQLKDDVAGEGADDVLEGETPEEIIASADEPTEPEWELDDDLRADDEELETLLLSGRTKGEEFLWVDPDDSGSGSEASDSDGLEDADESDDGESTASEPTAGASDETGTVTGDATTEPTVDEDETAVSTGADPETATETALVAVDGETADEPSTDESDVDESESAADAETSADDEAADDIDAADEDAASGLLGWVRSKLS